MGITLVSTNFHLKWDSLVQNPCHKMRILIIIITGYKNINFHAEL